MNSKQKEKAKRLCNKALCNLETYHPFIPVKTITELIENAGFFETSNLDGIYCGKDGRVNEHVGNGVYATISWHKMEVSGRYEIVAYVS